MREIKFRAFNKQTKEMAFFGIEDITNTRTAIVYKEVTLTLTGTDLFGAEQIERVPMKSLEDWEVMQWTGLTIRGVELYEGDIVEFTDKWEWYKGKYSVKMMFTNQEERARLKAEFDAEPMYRFVIKQHPFEGLSLSDYDLKEDRYQIIGNTWENPDLAPSP